MKLFRRLIADVKRGENIDLYLTVFVAVGLAVLNILGFAPPDLIAPLTLAILGLLAFSALSSRYQIEDSFEKLRQSSSNFFLDEFPSTFQSHLELSGSLLLVGVSLDRHISQFYSALERKARKGDRIRMLFVHPDGPALEMAISRALWETDIQVLRLKIQSSLQAAGRIKQIAPNCVEVRTIQNPLSYEAILINHGTSLTPKTIYIENYPYKSPKPYTPKHVFSEEEGKWYTFFESELLRLWDNGVEWTGAKQPENRVVDS